MSCTSCKDSGIVEKDGKLYECVCAYIKRRAAEMPAYIRKAQVLTPHLQLPVIKLIDKSLYVISAWGDTKAIVKVIMFKYPNKFIKITSDREIRDVYVGAASRNARGMSSNEDENLEIYNSLQDLMDLPDLMIVRLNEMHYKNKAAPGALEEAISYRLDRDKPVWMVSNIDKPFIEGSHAWSESVSELLATTFQKISIPRILPKVVLTVENPSQIMATPISQPNYVDEKGHSVSVMIPGTPSAVSPSLPGGFRPDMANNQIILDGAQERPKERQEKPFKKIRPIPDSDADFNPLSMYGSGVGKPKKFGNRD